MKCKEPRGSQDLSGSYRSSRQVKQKVRELTALKISIPWISIKGWVKKALRAEELIHMCHLLPKNFTTSCQFFKSLYMEHPSPNLINSKMSLPFLLDREAVSAGKITIYPVMKTKREQQGQIFSGSEPSWVFFMSVCKHCSKYVS